MKYWRELAFIAALLLLCAPPMFAADPLPASWQLTVPAVDVPTTQLVRVSELPKPERKLWDWKLVGMIAANHGATELDAWSTRRALARCPNCREANPFLAPVIDSRAKTALVMHGVGVGVDLLMVYLKSKGVKVWALPGFIKIGAHGFAAAHNSRLR